MSTLIPSSAPTPKKTKLKVLDFDGSLSAVEIEEYGRLFIRDNFSLCDTISQNPAFFCKTADGELVFFRSTYMKLLGKKVNGVRVCETSRVRRLHWIVPIIEDKVGEVVRNGDFDGQKLKSMGHKAIPGTIYRVYWVPARAYVVFLTLHVGKRGNSTFNLISAYRVSEASTRSMLDTLLPP